MSRRSISPRKQVPDLSQPHDPTGPSRQPKITPRNSEGEDTSEATIDTPWQTLKQLANIPRPTTPLRRASSAGPPSTRRRTPSGQAGTPGTGKRIGGSAKRPIAVTPHGRAAQRELDLRRAALTPGRDRRRSGRQQKETPRDILRNLSRILAPKTLPVVPTPQGPRLLASRRAITGDDDWDDDVELQRPRLSLPLGDDEDDDDSLLLPPRSAGLEDDNFTAQSIEMARRAFSEHPPGRLSRGSFGSIRMSDAFADLNDLGLLGDGLDSSYLPGGGIGDDGMPNAADDADLPEENTGTLRNLDFDLGRPFLTMGRGSDIRPTQSTGDDTETTFVFNIPQKQDSEEPEPIEEAAGSPAIELPDDVSEEDEPMDFAEDEMNGSVANEDEPSMLETTQDVTQAIKNKSPRKKKVKVSRYGLECPSLPAGVVKKLATTFARTAGNSKAKISKETLEAVMQATDWFFEQVGNDLGAYANHAGRKTIDESDIITLMGRQRQTNATTTPFSLAQRHLPRELLQQLRMVPPAKLKKGKRLAIVEEADEE